MAGRFVALVLAAGASSRFGSPKALAKLAGRPILEHTLEVVDAAGLAPVIVVLGHAADAIEAGIAWRGQTIARNPDPDTLSSSLRVGFAAVEARDPSADGVLVVLGDQPLTRPATIRALLDAASTTDRPLVAPRYAEGGGANPLLVRSAAFGLVREAAGDRGLGPLLASRPELVEWVPVEGDNPDVDTPADLALVDWAFRVRANREQVERLREVPDGADFYAPTASHFRADPDRRGDAVLDALRAGARPDDVWLDIGAGAGRYALPIARSVREVLAVDPSPSMLELLRADAREAGIRNIRALEGRWPPASTDPLADALGPLPCADVALMAHVGYDIEAVGPFLDAAEAAARRLCIAVLMDRTPATIAERFWPAVHGESRAALPALPAFVELLRALGREPHVEMVARDERGFGSRDELGRAIRRQLWIAEGGEKAQRYEALLADLAVETADGWRLREQPEFRIGVVRWAPQPGAATD